MTRILLITLLFLLEQVQSQTSIKDLNLDYGPYHVGYKHLSLIDSSRTYQIKNEYTNRSIFRPIPLSIWYPSQFDKSEQSMRVLNYLEILKAEEEWENLPNEFLLDWFPYLWNTPENRAHLTEQCKAIQNATPLNEKFPVVIYSPSYQATSIENFALCEYLASNGFVIISSPSRGTLNQDLFGGTLRDMETQSRDVEFLISKLSNFPFIDGNNLVLMGFSFGGLSNAITAMKNDRVKALISLDGTERYRYSILESSPYFDLERFRIPYLHMAQKVIPDQVLKEDNIPEKLNTEFQLYESSKRSKIYRIRFNDLSHSQFSSYGVLFTARDPRQDRLDQEIMASYRIMTTHILQFLKAVVINDKKAQLFMENKPEENGFAEGLIVQKIKTPTPLPFNFRDFNDLAEKQNFDKLIELYSETKLKHPSMELEESMLNTLGLHLSFNPETTKHGIKILHLAIYLYPNSSNLQDSLAEAYFFDENYEQAEIHFRESLKLDPQNKNATNRLKQLNN